MKFILSLLSPNLYYVPVVTSAYTQTRLLFSDTNKSYDSSCKNISWWKYKLKSFILKNYENLVVIAYRGS